MHQHQTHKEGASVKHRFMPALVFALGAALAGCATAPVQTTPQVDPAEVALRKALETQPGAMHAQSADAKAPAARLAGPLVTIKNYVGDAEPLLRRLATARGMDFAVTGPEPRLPLLIAIDADGLPLEALLHDIGHQFGQRADVVLGAGRIEIRYRGQAQ